MILSEWLTGRHKDVYATAAGDTTKAYFFQRVHHQNLMFDRQKPTFSKPFRSSTPSELAAPTPVTTPKPAPAVGPKGVT